MIYNDSERSLYDKIKHLFSDFKNMTSDSHLLVKSTKGFRDNIIIYQYPYKGYKNKTKYGDFLLLDKKRGLDMFVEVCSLNPSNSILAARINILFGLMKTIDAKQISLLLIGNGFGEQSDSMNDILANRIKDVPKDKEFRIFYSEKDFVEHIKNYFRS